MKKHISLTIPKPCSEKWNSFMPASHGRYCSSCSQTVIDFTAMSDNEILDFFNRKTAHTCGRFRPDQLKGYPLKTPPVNIHPGLKLFKAGLISLLLLLMNRQAFAQVASPKVRSEVVQYHNQDEKKTKTAAITQHIVQGVVISAEDKAPLPGVNILLKGTNVGTTTDADGRFEFPQQLNAGDVLYFSFIGFETLEYTVPAEAKEVFEIRVAMDYTVLMGAVAIEEAYAPKQSGFRHLWSTIKGLF